MQNQPQCYIDTDGRVACDVGGHMSNPSFASTTRITAATRAPAPPPARAKRPAPTCCVHILSKDLAGISPSSPRPGRIDCPQQPEIHDADVLVVAISPDGHGGMIASIVPGKAGGGMGGSASTFRAANAIGPMRLPVCSVGPQDQEPIPCCLMQGSSGEPLVSCEDTSHPMHGRPASEATAAGYTLELCPPPPQIPPCCVELGNFEGKNARFVCEDTNHVAHLRPVDVEVSPDQMSAAFKVGDHLIEVPICETEKQPHEIPCCVRDGVLDCPGTPYHGLPYEQVMQQYPNVRLLPCEDIPPATPFPQDCCVRRGEGRAVLVCSGNGPWNGYELKSTEYQCFEQNGQTLCTIALAIPGVPSMFTATLPVCDAGREPVPHDCCYDVATGLLVCTDTSSEWHGLKVSLIDLQSAAPHGAGYAMVAHPLLGSVPMKFPICEVPVPDDCCFEPADKPTIGSSGKIKCPSSAGLDGRDGTLVDVRVMGDGTMMGVVSFLGGSSRMRLCKLPPSECPECPPPYFCCVNIDTGRYVCPANDARHGQPAQVKEHIQIDGMPWVMLADGQRVPACGVQCPAPEPCKPPDLIPVPPNGECAPPPDVPRDPPDVGPPGPRTPPPCPPNGSGIPQDPPNIPQVPPGTPPQCPTNGSTIPQGSPNIPQVPPGTPPQCPTNGSTIPQGSPNIPQNAPVTPPQCPPNGGMIPQGGPNIPGTPMGPPPQCPVGGGMMIPYGA